MADEVVKPVEGLLNSSAVSHPHSTDPLRSRVWLLKHSQLGLPSPTSLRISILGAPGALLFDRWYVPHSSVILAERFPPTHLKFCSVGCNAVLPTAVRGLSHQTQIVLFPWILG